MHCLTPKHLFSFFLIGLALCLGTFTHADAATAFTPDAASMTSTPAPAPAAPQDAPPPSKETLITAARMAFDQNTGIATAAGHVEISSSGYILHADKVTFDQNKNVMHAEGHVSTLHPDGEVSFADQEDITGDMKQAYARNIGILFPDNSRLIARSMQRYDGRYMTGDHAVYTACNVCLEDPAHPPLWQLRSEKVVHDNETHDIYYHNTTIDIAGVPVLWTPYMSAPDPTVSRRQGFLAPFAGYTPDAGYFARVPYYFDIAPDKDFVLAPTFSQNDIVALGGTYRQRYANGSLVVDGTAAYASLLSENTGAEKSDRLRGNLDVDFKYDLTNVWRVGTTVNYVTDKSFLERYNMGSPSATTSRVFAEGFKGRDYAVVDSYYFQDLQPGTQPVQPAILPHVAFNALGAPGQTLGGRWSFDSSMLVTTRDNSSAIVADQGPETRRVSIDGGWDRRLVSDTGLVTDISGLLRGDAYWADNVPDPNGTGQIYNNVLLARQFEQANVVLSYPLGRHGEHYQQTLEPIVMLTAAPQVKQKSEQPIEDSLDIQFDDTNLFAPNRFTGTDLIEGGSRATYGLRQSLITDGGAKFDVFGGQSYSFTPDSSFPELSGLHDHSSDYVGRIAARPGDWLDLDYGFRFSHRDLSPEAQDAHLSFGAPIFRPSLRYVLAYQNQITGVVGTTEEAIIGFTSNFLKFWRLTAEHTQAFQPQPGPRQTSLALSYTDECFIFGVTAQRNDIDRFDIRPGTSILFHVYLRNLGGAHTDSISTPTYSPQFRQTNTDAWH
jgi:LPS-assembly protein